MQVRLATADDYGRLFLLAKDLPLTDIVELPAFEAGMQAVLEDPSALLAVAHEYGEMAGYILGFRHPTFHANAPAAWVEELYVRKDFRGRGFGTSLVAFFEDWAKSEGCAYLALSTRRAGEFYEKIGFENRAVYFKRPIRA